ncbi:hypothetical protein DMA12_33000, partial [Amycolatopsis balhimycina DSM 5908]
PLPPAPLPPSALPAAAPAPETAPRTPAWSFGREEPPSRSQPAPAWSFERPRVTADAAETTLMPAVRDEPAPPWVRPPEPRVRQEPAVARRRPEPPQARQPVEERPAPKPEPEVRPAPKPEPAEVRPTGKRSREPEFSPEPVARPAPPERRPDAAEVRPPERRPEPEPAPGSEIGKTKFSWAALAEARLRETAAERESAPTRITPALPLAPEPAAEREPWAPEERRRREPQPSTRHDAEHGSEAARSVLDRLGISASGGAGGGRRRAEDTERPRAEEPARPEPELAPPPRPEDQPPSVPDYRDEVEPWLPRLRMPPTLEPMEDFGHWTPATAPFPESYARAISEDEPPPDAGLADLLARALAEHQAGTASAAALVKQLGSQDTGRRNGHGRNGHGAEVPDSRRRGSAD